MEGAGLLAAGVVEGVVEGLVEGEGEGVAAGVVEEGAGELLPVDEGSSTHCQYHCGWASGCGE